MPYNIRQVKGKYCVFNKTSGENKGCSDTRERAISHMRALYHAEGGGKFTKSKK